MPTINARLAAASVLMALYDVSFEMILPTSDLLLAWVIVFDREYFELPFRASGSVGVLQLYGMFRDLSDMFNPLAIVHVL